MSLREAAGEVGKGRVFVGHRFSKQMGREGDWSPGEPWGAVLIPYPPFPDMQCSVRQLFSVPCRFGSML